MTAWWAAVTQWFFGPALIDRGFRLTGGICDLAVARSAEQASAAGGALGKGMDEARELLTSAACKLAGGRWKGGHDISGHVFLLTLGSAFLGMEILPVVLRKAGLREERRVRARDGGVGRAVVGGEGRRMMGAEEAAEGSGVGAPVLVAGLSWWMLLMTAAYFHTWFEKVNLPPSFFGRYQANRKFYK